MSRSLSSLVDQILHKNEFKDYECRFKSKTIKNYEKEFEEELKKRFNNTYKLFIGDFSKFGFM